MKIDAITPSRTFKVCRNIEPTIFIILTDVHLTFIIILLKGLLSTSKNALGCATGHIIIIISPTSATAIMIFARIDLFNLKAIKNKAEGKDIIFSELIDSIGEIHHFQFLSNGVCVYYKYNTLIQKVNFILKTIKQPIYAFTCNI
jgi:hypothetical protein